MKLPTANQITEFSFELDFWHVTYINYTTSTIDYDQIYISISILLVYILATGVDPDF